MIKVTVSRLMSPSVEKKAVTLRCDYSIFKNPPINHTDTARNTILPMSQIVQFVHEPVEVM